MKNKFYQFFLFSAIVFFQFDAVPSFGQTTYTESFDGATFPPPNWLDFPGTGTNLWIRGTNGALINPTIASHSGAGVAMWNSYSIVAPNTANLVTPNIDESARGSNTPTFSLWWVRDVANYNTSIYKLEGITIYANTTPNLTGSPDTLGFIPRCGTCANATGTYLASGPATASATGWYQYVFNIPAIYNTATNYIIIKAYAQDGNNCFMDDISWVSYGTNAVNEMSNMNYFATICPNPSTEVGATRINYSLQNACDVKIEIYNSIGQKIDEFFYAMQTMGNHEMVFHSKTLRSGIYFVKINAGGNEKVLKMIRN